MSFDSDIEKLKKRYIGKRIGPYHAWNPVSRAQVWQWCTAMGDENSLYLGGAKAIAPPTMLQMWAFRDMRGNYAPGSTDKDVYEVLAKLDELGFSGTVAVSYNQTYHSYLKEGDRVHNYSSIVKITDQTSTRLGDGYFVTEQAEYFKQNDDCFGEASITYFKYRPPAMATTQKAPETRRAERIRPVENHDSAHYWQGLRDNKLLLQKCGKCDTFRHPPQPMCEVCQSLQWSAVASQGFGTIYSYTVIHYPEIPPFDYPNAIVLVDMDEGVRLAYQLVDLDPEAIQIGLKVKVRIDEVQEGLSLPVFVPVSKQTGKGKLPELKIPITARQIVSGAIASQDFEDVHHDKAAAQAAGTPDIFMNILTTNGLVGRYLTDWAGPKARLVNIALNLGVPNFPGDNMVMSGTVIAINGKKCEVAFKGKNDLGNHVTGTAVLMLPKPNK